MSPWKRIVSQTIVAAAGVVALAAVTRSRGRASLAVTPTGWGPDQLTAAVVAIVCGAACLATVWHLVSCLALLVAMRPQAHRARSLVLGWGTPWARRIVAGALVAGLGATPAWATPVEPGAVHAKTATLTSVTVVAEVRASQGEPATSTDTAPVASDDLGWTPTLPDPGAPAAGADAPAAAETPGAGANAADSPRDAAPSGGEAMPDTVTVTPGDSLWSLTATLLGPTASDAQVALAWPRLYATNASVVGADPSVIHPGTVLTVPSDLSPVPAP